MKTILTKRERRLFKEWLVRKNLTLTEFAKLCGVSKTYISRVINGKENITDTVIQTFFKGGYIL